MFKKIWNKIRVKKADNEKLTRKEQVLLELKRGQGTARQLSDRMGLGLNIVRSNLSVLHKEGLIRDTEDNVNQENIWEVVEE
jgi:predicted ArsR family transcriptional regulator